MQRFTNWRKSSRSADTGNCVEVAAAPKVVGVRDTKDRAAGHFTVTRQHWQTFVGQIKSGHYDQ